MTNVNAAAQAPLGEETRAKRLLYAIANSVPRLADHIFQPADKAPIAVQHALGLMIDSLAVTPTGNVYSRAQAAWPPHRPRRTSRRCSTSDKRMQRRLRQREMLAEPTFVGTKGLR